MYYFYLILLVLSFNAIHASIYSSLKQNVLSLLYGDEANQNDALIRNRRDSMRRFNTRGEDKRKQLDEKDKKSAQEIANNLRRAKALERGINKGRDKPPPIPLGRQIRKEDFQMDPVLNELMFRRSGMGARRADSSAASNYDAKSSSSTDEQFWMDDWEEHWMKKKFEALNSTMPRGDVVNMVAARPWGVACGDPNQHDMPWGSCMLPMECEAEYRIYRGDYFCGRTSYICCALQATNYDMYQGLDVSFEATSLEAGSDEKKKKSKKSNRKKEGSKRKKRRRERRKRKKDIHKSIKRIIREIKRILTKAYRNGTAQRKKKTQELKRFVDMMKKKYRKDRKAIVNVHEFDLVKVDEKLQAKLNHILGVNKAFMGNDTFRDIVVNGTVNKENLDKFLRAHPELENFFKSRRIGLDLKPEMEEQNSKSDNEKRKPKKRKPKVLDYDLEFGMLYY